MRNTIINTIFESAKINKNIVLLTADLGYSVLENFQNQLPEQFCNVGIAEQNMIGVAAGLALSGKKVFVYTIVPFATMRCFEQIRIDVCYQNLDVTIIGVGGGYAYGTLGTTHYAIEDIAIMRSLPKMKIISPADKIEAKLLIGQVLEQQGPFYIRLNRGGETDIHKSDNIDLKIGDGIQLSENSEILLISTGNITQCSVEAADRLAAEGIGVTVVSLSTLKPVNKEYLSKILSGKKYVFSLEEHNINGGLGSIVAEFMAENQISAKFSRLGINDEYLKEIGKQDYMRDLAGISSEKVYEYIRKQINSSI